MGYEIHPFHDLYTVTGTTVAQTLFKNEQLSIDIFCYYPGNRLIVHQREDELHNQLAIIILEGELDVTIEDRCLTLHEHDMLNVRDVYLFECYAEQRVKLLYISTGEVKLNYEDDSLKLMVTELEHKDVYTKEHNRRVGRYATQMMHLLDSTYNRVTLSYAATFHDVGKINVPDEILNKPDRLTDDEFAVIQRHPQDSYTLIRSHMPEEVAEIAYQHHERLDGSGYPRGLRGDEICLEARILAVADMFDAMTTTRSYRAAFPFSKAMEIIRGDMERGKLDARCVGALQALIDKGAIQ